MGEENTILSELNEKCYFFLSVHNYFVYMYICAPPEKLCSLSPEESVGSPVTGVTNSSELPCCFWELKPSSLQEQEVLLCLRHLCKPILHS